MSNEIQPANSPAFMQSRQLSAAANVGSIAIEQERAIAEAQGKLILAKKFPRDENQAFSLLMRACSSKAFASTAFYTVPNRGTGPSIRMAEEIARCYGNFKFGHRELSRTEGKSEIEVWAWDMERNIESTRQITVLHIQDSNAGAKPLRNQNDIDGRIANVASKQMRGRILALLPKWLVAEAIDACRATLAGEGTVSIEDRVLRLQKAFAKLEVTTAHLERYLGHTLKDTLPEEIADLQGVYNAIKDGTPASEYFEAEKKEVEPALIVAAAAEANAPTEPVQKKTRSSVTTKPKTEPEPPTPVAEKPKEETRTSTPTQKQAPEPEPEPSALAQEQAQPQELAAEDDEGDLF